VTDVGAAPAYPPGRYGRRREPRGRRRLLVGLLAAAMVLGALAVAARMYTQYGRAGYTPTVLHFEPVGDTAVDVTFVVDKPGGGPAVCLVRAVTVDAAELASATVGVPAGTRTTVTYRLATPRRPYLAQVTRCTAAG
jgi:hypothetical protein